MVISFKWIGGATWILKCGDISIACDPVLCGIGTVQDYTWFKSVRREEPVYNIDDFRDIDLWLITHGHEDHLDALGLRVIEKNIPVVSSGDVRKKIADRGADISVLTWGEKKLYNISGYSVTVECMPAYHGKNIILSSLAGKVNGYWVTVAKDTFELQIYVSGDTVFRKEIAKALAGRSADIYIPNIGRAVVKTPVLGKILGPLTLDFSEMMKVKNLIHAKKTIPVHYNTFAHYIERLEPKDIASEEILAIKPGEIQKIDMN